MAFALTTSMNEMIILPFELSQRQDVLYAAPSTIVLRTRATIAKRIKIGTLCVHVSAKKGTLCVQVAAHTINM